VLEFWTYGLRRTCSIRESIHLISSISSRYATLEEGEILHSVEELGELRDKLVVSDGFNNILMLR
jgi:hypothetical protein